MVKYISKGFQRYRFRPAFLCLFIASITSIVIVHFTKGQFDFVLDPSFKYLSAKSSSFPVIASQDDTTIPTSLGDFQNVYNKTTSKVLQTDKIIEYHRKGLDLRKMYNCSLLFDSEVQECQKVTKDVKGNRVKESLKSMTDSDAYKIVKNCKRFILTRRYRQTSRSVQEANFPLAYVVLMHQNFEPMERLIRTLYQPQNVFCIHVDLKSPESLYKAAKAYASCFPNIQLASTRYNVTYAHVSRLLGDIICMKDLSKLKHPWRYLMNTVSTEFPLRSNKEKVDIFTMMNGMNDIREALAIRIEERYTRRYYPVNGMMKRTQLVKSPAPHNITIVKGRAGNAFSRAFVDWFHKDPMAQDLLQWSMDTYSPDEHYWGTLNDLYDNPFLHTPGGYNGSPDTKRYMSNFAVWTSKDPSHSLPCHGTRRHNLCIFGTLDLPLIKSQPALWANKFNLDYDPVAYACMEELIHDRETNPKPIDLSLYRQKQPTIRKNTMKAQQVARLKASQLNKKFYNIFHKINKSSVTKKTFATSKDNKNDRIQKVKQKPKKKQSDG